MKKIASLFQRNYDGDRLVRDEIVPGSEWVAAGEGIATRKYDGTSCMMREDGLYKRYDAKKGKEPPAGFIAAQDPDPITKHWPGWVPARNDDPSSKWHIMALGNSAPEVGRTYELCGPKIQGNPEGFSDHLLIEHGCHVLFDAPRTFAELKLYFEQHDFEGIVWHHADGRMVKIRGNDFGIKRGISDNPIKHKEPV